MRGRKSEGEQEDRAERRGKSERGCGESMKNLSQLIELRKIYKVFREC